MPDKDSLESDSLEPMFCRSASNIGSARRADGASVVNKALKTPTCTRWFQSFLHLSHSLLFLARRLLFNTNETQPYPNQTTTISNHFTFRYAVDNVRTQPNSSCPLCDMRHRGGSYAGLCSVASLHTHGFERSRR